jgi:DNA-binding transcriptional regulator LsrR (DeoR family)
VPALIAGMKLAATNVLITNEDTAKALLGVS